MIFVTVGTSPRDFSRLLAGADRTLGLLKIEASFQIGYSHYTPRVAVRTRSFLTREEYLSEISTCEIVIAHAGIGALLAATRAGKGIVMMPRLKKYGEIDDDHQTEMVEIVRALEGRVRAAVVFDSLDLGKAILHVQEMPQLGTSLPPALAFRIADYVGSISAPSGDGQSARDPPHD